MKSSYVFSSAALNITRFSASIRSFSSFSPNQNSVALLSSSIKCNSVPITTPSKPTRLFVVRVTNSESVNLANSAEAEEGSNDAFVDGKNEVEQTFWNFEVRKPIISVPFLAKLSFCDQAFFLLAFIGCTTSVAFTSLVVAAVPTLHAMGRAATSLSRLADTAREELPSTMAAIRLSGMEVSDLTLELSDLSQEIAAGVTKSAQAMQAAEAGIRQVGILARQQTMSMIQERASLPIISLQPIVVGAAKKTSQAVGQATKTIMNMISGADLGTEDEDDSGIDRVEI